MDPVLLVDGRAAIPFDARDEEHDEDASAWGKKFHIVLYRSKLPPRQHLYVGAYGPWRLLAGAGILTLEDLLELNWADIQNIRGIGLHSRGDIQESFAARSLRLPRHPQPPLPEQHTVTKEEQALPIEDLGLAASTVGTLQAGGVGNFGDLVDMTRADLLRIPGVGPVMAREIVAVLKEQGLALTLYFDFVKPDAPVTGGFAHDSGVGGGGTACRRNYRWRKGRRNWGT